MKIRLPNGTEFEVPSAEELRGSPGVKEALAMRARANAEHEEGARWVSAHLMHSQPCDVRAYLEQRARVSIEIDAMTKPIDDWGLIDDIGTPRLPWDKVLKEGDTVEVIREDGQHARTVVARYTKPTPPPHVLTAVGIPSAEAVGTPTIKATPQRIAMPAGHGMTRAAGFIFFFSPKTFKRISEEVIADYQREMINAEARGASPAELRKLRMQYWGAFIWTLVREFENSALGRLWKVLTGG